MPIEGRRGAVRLLVSGYYGAGNLGDEALLAGLLGELRNTPVTPLVASVDPAATRREHRVAAVNRVTGLPAALLRCDALLSGGGGLLQDATSRRSLVYYLGVVRAARALKRPVVVFAQSLGPLSPAGADRVRQALAGVPLGLRDRPSLELAARLGLDARPVADTALLLQPPAGAASAGAAPAAPVVLLPRAGYPEIGVVMAELGRRHVATGGRVRIATVHPEHDLGEAQALRAALPTAELIAPRSVTALCTALVGARAVVSGRLHGMVLGAVVGAPVAGLAYDPKVRGFADQLAAPVVPVPASGDAQARAAAVATLERFVSAPILDSAAFTRARELAREGVRWLLEEALHVGS